MEVIIFADGACRGNPGPGGWGSLCVFNKRVKELGGAKNPSTNNEMELAAVLASLQLILPLKDQLSQVAFYLDSQYVLSGMMKWRHGWKKRAWKTSTGEEVKNKETWQAVDELMNEFKNNSLWKFYYTPGHSGIPGNERADVIAASFADGLNPELYEGSLQGYPEPVMDGLSQFQEFEPNRTSNTQSKAKTLYYLSYVGGQLYRDDSWPQCQARVQGVAGAKYKKIRSAQEEEQTLKNWGV